MFSTFSFASQDEQKPKSISEIQSSLIGLSDAEGLKREIKFEGIPTPGGGMSILNALGNTTESVIKFDNLGKTAKLFKI